MTAKKTHEEFVDQFNQVHKGKVYQVVSEYVSNRRKVAIQCQIHGIWEAFPSNLLKGCGCPSCAIKRSADKNRSTFTEFVAKLNLVHRGKGYQAVGEYINNKTKLAFKCPVHGVWAATPDTILSGSGCPQCGTERGADKQKITHAEFLTKFNQVHEGKGYQVVGEYVNNRTKIAIECLIHGVWEAAPAHLLQGKGCSQCATKQNADKRRKSQAEFIDQFNQVHEGKGYKVVGEYVGDKTKIAIECLIHGVWEALPTNLLKGQGCPSCTKYGFNPNLPATFYVYEIIKNKDIYFGFGISNIYEQREKQHLKNLTESGANIAQKWLYEFESGYECRGLEDDLKAVLTEANLNHNLGIDGFHTECAKEEARSLIMQHINKAICQPIHVTP